MLSQAVSSSQFSRSFPYGRAWLRPSLGGAGLCFALSMGCSSTDAPPPSSAQGGTGATSGSASTGGSSGGSTAGGAGNQGGSPGAGGSAGSSAGGASAGASGGGQAGMAGSGGTAGSSVGGASGMGGGGGGGGEMKSGGCGKMRTLKDGANTVQSGGMSRGYQLRVPSGYDNMHAYHLMLGFHGATGKGSDIAPSYFGLWDLSQGSTIFAAPDAIGGIWSAMTDTTMVSDLLKALEGDLCIDTSHVGIEGFSQGGAMVWTLACALPGTFRFAVVHSGGGLAMPQTCQPIPFFSSLGNDGSGQGMSSDFFAQTNGCTVAALPMAPSGGHACNDYMGCSAGHPTRWCDYDGGHTPSPTDSGQSMSWMPQEVWTFVKARD